MLKNWKDTFDFEKFNEAVEKAERKQKDGIDLDGVSSYKFDPLPSGSGEYAVEAWAAAVKAVVKAAVA